MTQETTEQETLLQKAKRTIPYKAKSRTEITKEHIELALAWARGEVNYVQAAQALGLTGSNLYAILAMSLQQYILNNDANIPKAQ